MNSTVFCKKNAAILIVIALIVAIPTVLAVMTGKNAPETVISETTEKIIVRAPDGTEVSMTAKEDLDFYSSLIGNARRASADYLADPEQTPFFVTVGESDGMTQVYSFYPSGEKGDCLFANAAGEYFVIDKEYASPLFLRTEFAYANVSAVIPNAVITIFDKTYVLKPESGEWIYYTAGGEELSRTVSPAADAENVTVRFASEIGTLSFEGDAAPSSCTVVLSSNGTESYSGTYENIVSADMLRNEKDTYYDLTIDAVWDAAEANVPHGTVTYRGRLLYDIPADYEILFRASMSVGDFGLIRMHNFNDGDTLYASCEGYPVPETLQVFTNPTDPDTKIAFIPASLDKVGEYVLTLKTDDSQTVALPLTVKTGKAPRVADQVLTVTNEALQAAYTEATVDEFKSLVKELTVSSDNKRYWDGRFLYPNNTESDSASEGLAKFGTNRKINSVHSASEIYFADEVEMAEGTGVVAANNGIVVFSGTLDYTGNTVIIDHGCSLLSVYGHLASADVQTGAEVMKGDVIGKCGSTGFAAKAGADGPSPYVLFAISIDGGFVNPLNLVPGVSFAG